MIASPILVQLKLAARTFALVRFASFRSAEVRSAQERSALARSALEALKAAARRGVDVRVLVPWVSNHVLADWIAHSYFTEGKSSL